MCATEDNKGADQSLKPLIVQSICLDLQLKAESYRDNFVNFLDTNRSGFNFNGEEDLAAPYLERVWSNGVPGSMIVSNASFDKFERWNLRPPVDGPMAKTFAVNGLVPTFGG